MKKSYITKWDPKTTIECGEYTLETQPYRTGGVQKIIIDSCENTIGNSFIKSMFRSREPIERRFSWLPQSDFAEEADVENIALAYEKIDELVCANNISELDELLEILITWDISYELQSSILRYTFSIKNKIPMWQSAFNNFVHEMEKRNMDTEGILLGLA